MIVGEGKYGPYVHYDKLYISIPRGIDPLSLKPEEAITLIEEKRQSALPVHAWGDIQVLRSVREDLDAETVRVISSSPKWIPGRQNGEPVPVTFTFPVVFKLK